MKGKLGKSYRRLDIGEEVKKGDIYIVKTGGRVLKYASKVPVQETEFILRVESPWRLRCPECYKPSLACEYSHIVKRKVYPNYIGDSVAPLLRNLVCPKCKQEIYIAN